MDGTSQKGRSKKIIESMGSYHVIPVWIKYDGQGLKITD